MSPNTSPPPCQNQALNPSNLTKTRKQKLPQTPCLKVIFLKYFLSSDKKSASSDFLEEMNLPGKKSDGYCKPA